MRELSTHEINAVAAGELVCTVGNTPTPCSGASFDLSGAYTTLVGAATDAIEKLANWWGS